ncbi:unnamed protein product [Tenebrio molitor]|nr:unnamed protein product [Tenebrio molitor]
MKRLVVLLTMATATVALNQTALQEFASNNSLLTSDIYKELTKSYKENFLVSPFSVETVLALLQSGAVGETAEELRTSLRLPNTREQTESVIANLLPKLADEQYVLNMANKIYVKENFPVHEEFKKIASGIYAAELENIDFDKKSEAVKTINDWVEAQTNKKIQDIIKEDDLTDRSRLILISALYLKANWSLPFPLIATTLKDFYGTPEKAVSVKTMRNTNTFNYYECSEVDAKFLELPFKGDDASLIVVLPNEKQGIANLESKIDKVFTPRPFTKELVKVDLPRFKIETTIDFEDVLKKLGINRAFDAEKVDLSGIAGKKGELEVSSVVQKTFIDVCEEGIEAAAATAVQITLFSGHYYPPEVIQFHADHPFIFYIKVKDLIVFAGRVKQPSYN